MKFKKLGAAVIAAAMATALIPATAVVSSAIVVEEAIVANGLTFTELSDGTLSVSGLDDETLTEIVIPASVNGVIVTAIGEDAFRRCSNITSVTIPEGVKEIGFGAFWYCTSLKNITIPDGVTHIGSDAFYHCESLKSIELPDSVTDIDSWAFYACTTLTSIVIPDGVTEIANATFEFCYDLTEVTIPDSVTKIGDYAFNGCSSLKSLTLPDSVSAIELYTFSQCTNLTNITYKQNTYTAYEIYDAMNPDKAHDENGLLIEDGKIVHCLENVVEVVIPDGVTEIGANAFKSCKNLKNITIPDTVTEIGYAAFQNCQSLTSFTVPKGVTKINTEMLYECKGLTNIEIHDNVTEIGSRAFAECTSLTEITIPDSVTSIYWSFQYCENLENVTLGNGLVEIGQYTFASCPKLKSIDIPESVTTISSYAFSNSGLININGTPGSYAETFAAANGYTFNSEVTETPDIAEPDEFESNGVTATADDGVIPDGAEFSVEPKSSNESNTQFSYEINFTLNGEKIQPNGYVTVKIPVPEALVGKTIFVYRVSDTGRYTRLSAEVVDGYIVFKTNHFSEYILSATRLSNPADDDDDYTVSDTSSTNNSANNSGTTANPNTGFAELSLTMGLLALAGAAVVVSKKKK